MIVYESVCKDKMQSIVDCYNNASPFILITSIKPFSKQP